MDSEKILEWIKKRPFLPFRIRQSDGTIHDVVHPDQIMVDRRTCHLGIGSDPTGVFQRITMISNVHITRLEPLDPPERQSA